MILDLSGRVLIFSRIAGILHKCRIYRCACLRVLIFHHAPTIKSGRTCLGVFLADLVRSRLQNFKVRK
nr:MAG TPA: hypothetical protein [Caudoviricetes sp.]